ncbi:MAG: hypothetical protein CVV24_14140 [Ignavibacteriae bacterium HGW-Ignavibacteriae-3]|nr:MAG: hypothetical protein CVV24_14140 [Ignavibacteriae bacterium HGW-Ignavibacteriae-3]
MRIFALLFIFISSLTSHPQSSTGTQEQIIFKAANVTPAPGRYEWQKLEFIAFAHYGINTFTGREWGDGSEDPKFFKPTEFDARQWTNLLKDSGVKMLILTAKHNDGFCLTPSKYTEHSFKNSARKNWKGDIVRDVSEECKESGLIFGVYLSPRDRNNQSCGDSPIYNEYFRSRLAELLSDYEEITEVWFYIACGEGPNGKRQIYDWQSYYKIIRELQPGAVIFGMAPDVRCVGTESGSGRETEWSVLPDENKNTIPSEIKLPKFTVGNTNNVTMLGSPEKLYLEKEATDFKTHIPQSLQNIPPREKG